MHRYLFPIFLCAVMFAAPAYSGDMLARDTSDPLYMLGHQEFLTNTSVTYGDSILRLGQAVSYGVTDRLSIGGNVHYQFDFSGRDEFGFSAIDLGGVYRLARAGDNSARIISDVIAGFKVGGAERVRVPWFADSTYYAGLRFGRQWTGMTLAATVKSSWIFDNVLGMSYIDLVPEAYFRISENWRLGASFTLRKSTNPRYNQEWLGGRIIRQYGRTQYVGRLDYEFEHDNFQVGANINILF